MAKVIFLHLSVILFTGRVSASVHAGIPPPRADTPAPRGRHPLGADTPRSRHPPGADTPWEQTAPRGADSPLREADSGIRSMSGRYASYWNAFLFLLSSVSIGKPNLTQTECRNLYSNNRGFFPLFFAHIVRTAVAMFDRSSKYLSH